MTRFYTKKGDDGYTGLLGEGRAAKYDPRIETIGIIDEANASIALARSISIVPETASTLKMIQKDLYLIMAEVASTPENAANFRKITGLKVDWLEAQIERVSSIVTVPQEFILPGDTTSGATFDLARTIVRRAERSLSRLLHSKLVENQELLRYMNRLSSLLFIFEILENKESGIIRPTLVKD